MNAAQRRDAHLVSAGMLHALLDSTNPPTILDVRWDLSGSQPGEFSTGHIPGAVFVDLDTELSDPTIAPEIGGRHPLPSAADFTVSARAWGVSARQPVVVMDAGTGLAAARAWWLLRWFGHSDVRLLDGGYAAWQRAGFEEARGETGPVAEGDFVAVAGGMPIVELSDVTVQQRPFALLDARAAERYRGDVEPVDPVPGHIPGSINVPAADAVDSDGGFRATEELARGFASAGISPGDEVVSSCGSGVTAAHQVLALALIGVEAGLFPGSYSQWCRTPGLPTVRGDRQE